MSNRVTANVSQLPEGGDFGDENCQPSTNFDSIIKLDLTTEPPISCWYCYGSFFFVLSPNKYPIAKVINGVIIAQKSFIGNEISSVFNPIQQ